MQSTINFLLAGVGGQGTILASDVLVNVGLAAGYQAKQAEVHGMSQRGGSVTSYVRWGQAVHSPLVGAGEVDVYLAFEKVEALRNLNQLRRGALAVINMHAIPPVTVTSGDQPYPDDDRLRSSIAQVTDKASVPGWPGDCRGAGQCSRGERGAARCALGADGTGGLDRIGAAARRVDRGDHAACAGEVRSAESEGVRGGAPGGVSGLFGQSYGGIVKSGEAVRRYESGFLDA